MTLPTDRGTRSRESAAPLLEAAAAAQPNVCGKRIKAVQNRLVILNTEYEAVECRLTIHPGDKALVEGEILTMAGGMACAISAGMEIVAPSNAQAATHTAKDAVPFMQILERWAVSTEGLARLLRRKIEIESALRRTRPQLRHWRSNLMLFMWHSDWG